MEWLTVYTIIALLFAVCAMREGDDLPMSLFVGACWLPALIVSALFGAGDD